MMQNYKIYSVSVLWAMISVGMIFAAEDTYLLKHLYDLDCEEIVKFVKLDDKGELILGGFHITNISHDNVEKFYQARKDPKVYEALKKRMETIQSNRHRALSWHGSYLPYCIQDKIISYLSPSDKDLSEYFAFNDAEMQLFREQGDTLSYPKHTAVGWNIFNKQDPELAQRVMRNDYLGRLDAHVRFCAGNSQLLEKYLKTASCRVTNRYDRRKAPFLSNSFGSRVLVHKDAEKLFLEKLKEAAGWEKRNDAGL
jgi:hypothetical protein